MQYEMCVYDFCRNVDWRAVGSFEDMFLGVMYVVLLAYLFFFLLLAFLVPTGFLEHVDNIASQYFMAERACLLNSLPS